MMEFLTEYNLTGLVIGVATFLIIGLFHPFVIKGEYYFGVRCWWFFLLMGVAAIAASVAVRHILWSTLLAVCGATRRIACGQRVAVRRGMERAAAAIFGCVRRTASYSCGCVGGMFAGGVRGV